MAITLGEIAVRLTANTAEFISGFSAAGAGTKRFRADLSEHIGAVGGILERGLAQFGEFGEAVGGTLGRATSAAGQAILSFGRFGGALGTIVGAGAGVAAGLAVAEAGIIGIAIHTAESAAKLGEMSEKAGVTSQTLAGLALAGKGVGVETESLVKALGFMGSNAVKAAIASDYAHTAFGRLGIQVKDTAGNMKDGGQLFLEVVGRIAALPTSEQGFFVKQIFGRGGIEILPLINKGVDAIAEKMELATKFGLGDAGTIEGARKFKETIDDIKASFEGVALELTKNLLPSIEFLSEELLKASSDGSLKTFVDDMGQLVKSTLALGEVFKSVFEQIGLFLEYVGREAIALFNLIGGGLESIGRAGIGDFSGAKQALTGSYDYFIKQTKDFDTQSRAIWQGNAEFIDGIFGKKAVNPFKGADLSGVSSQQLARTIGASAGFASSLPFHADALLASLAPKKISADLSGKGEGSRKEDTTLARINDRIDALHREAGAWAAIAAAGSQGETLIAQATEKANAEFAKQVDLADKDKTGRAQKRIAEAEATLKADVANSFYAQTFVKINDELAKEDAKLKEQTSSILASASAHGLAAIAAAAINEQLSSERAKVDQVTAAYDKLIANDNLFRASKAKLGAAAGPPEGEQANLVTLAEFRDEIAKNAIVLNQLAAEKERLAAAKLSDSLNLDEEAAKRASPAIAVLNAAYLQTADAVRAARIELELVQFAETAAKGGVNLGSPEGIALIERKRAALKLADDQAYQGALAQESVQFNILAQYDNEIVKLQRIQDLMRSQGISTLGVEAQIFDEQNRLIHQWDEWAFKVGGFRDKFRGVMGELIIQGRLAGSAISQAFLTAIDGVETSLAKLLTGQKADFKGVFTNLAESVTKAEIQKGIGKLAEHIPGLGDLLKGTGPLGSSARNPMFVSIVDGGPPSVPFGGKNPFFGSGIGASEGGEGSASSGGGFFGFLGGLLHHFGGFHALGGSIPSGQWGITGERGPEIVTGPANVIPAGSTYNITHNHNYPSADSRDLFGRTQKQNQARQMRNSRLAYAF